MRLEYMQLSKTGYSAMGKAHAELAQSLDPQVIHLVHMRISQINECAACCGIHSKDALKAGVSDVQLYCLSGWRETDLYTSAQMAALNWAEVLTKLGQERVSDNDFDALKDHFSDAQISDLTLSISLMNAFNRIGISMQLPIKS